VGFAAHLLSLGLARPGGRPVKVTAGIVLILLPATAIAGEESSERVRFEISPALGVMFPVGDFSDEASGGFAGGLDFVVNTSERLAFGCGAAYSSVGVVPSEQPWLAVGPQGALASDEAGSESSGSLREVTGYARVFLGPPSRERAYLRFGAGFMRFHEETSGSASSDDWVGFLGGLGVQVRGERAWGGFGEVLVSEVLLDHDSSPYLAFRGGLTFFRR
jgi:hypothetical protein